MIWNHVSDNSEGVDVKPHQVILRSVVEKWTMINLILAFAVSVKVFLLRSESIRWQREKKEVGHANSDGSSMIDSEKAEPANELEDTTPKPEKKPLIWKTTIYDHIALLCILRWCIQKTLRFPPPRVNRGIGIKSRNTEILARLSRSGGTMTSYHLPPRTWCSSSTTNSDALQQILDVYLGIFVFEELWHLTLGTGCLRSQVITIVIQPKQGGAGPSALPSSTCLDMPVFAYIITAVLWEWVACSTVDTPAAAPWDL
ncbi:hypothetical protein BDQ12DRAFT_670922 [Crucibulum laeve]|uniref:Uncharacterized protein n=1 Tax=Crucibulum laeve TaxID=68775 RepID=A0A5C3LJ23_9AGAR|nr:hypothetical protein BDQ12DRAFT_670922 [Crucibulum laeve]